MDFAKEGVRSLLFQVAGALCGIAAGALVARALGPSARGVVAVALLYPGLFATVLNLTAGATIVHYLGKREHEEAAVVGTAVAMVAGMSLVGAALFGGTLVLWRDTLYRGVAAQYLALAYASVPCYLALYYFSSVLQSRMDLRAYNLANQMLGFSNLLVLVAFLMAGRLDEGAAVLAGVSGIALGGAYATLKVLRRVRGIRVDWGLTASIVADSLKMHLGSVAAFTWMQSNFLVLNYLAPPAETGYYAVALGLANTLYLVSLALEVVVFPGAAHASPDEAASLVEAATRHLLVVLVPAALLLVLFAKPVVAAYGGPEFARAAGLLAILVPGVVASVAYRLLGIFWLRLGRFWTLTGIAVAVAVVGLGASLVLVPRAGALGAALALSIANGAAAALSLFLFCRTSGRGLRRLLVPTGADFATFRDLLAARTSGAGRRPT